MSTLSGEPTTLHATLRRPTLLVFFASWCVVCRSEIPALNALHHTTKDRGFDVIAVAVDDAVPDLRRFIAENDPRYPIYIDDQRVFKRAFKITGFPESILLDKAGAIIPYQESDGNITVKTIGSRDWTGREFVDQALALAQR